MIIYKKKDTYTDNFNLTLVSTYRGNYFSSTYLNVLVLEIA